MTDDTLTDLEHVTFRLDGTLILNDVSFSVGRKKITTIIGPNGAGKTTLLKIILGILQPTSGKIVRAPDLKIGYVPQKFTIPTTIPLTVERFLCLDKKHTSDELTQALTEAGIPHLLKKSIHPLSGGEKQRLMLARSLLGQTDLLVLDEPAQGLDPMGEEDFYTLLSELNETRGCAILMVSHDLHTVMAQTDEVICLNHHICCSGAPEEVVKSPDYSHLFGEGISHLAIYQHKHDHTHPFGGGVQNVPVE